MQIDQLIGLLTGLGCSAAVLGEVQEAVKAKAKPRVVPAAEHTVFVLKDKWDRAEAHRQFLQETAERKQREYEAASQRATGRAVVADDLKKAYWKARKELDKTAASCASAPVGERESVNSDDGLANAGLRDEEMERVYPKCMLEHLEVPPAKRVKARSSTNKSSPDQLVGDTAPVRPPVTQIQNLHLCQDEQQIMRAVQSWSPEAVDRVVRLCTEHRKQEEALQGLLGNLSVGDKEGISSDGWTVVKKTKKLLCPQSTVSGVAHGSFRAPICKSGTKSSSGLNISGPRCSQIQMGFNASPFSGPNNAGSSSAGTNVHPILNDPEVRSLERLLRVKSKVELRLPGRLLDKPPVSVSANKVLEASAGENASVLEMSEASTALRESGSHRLAENASEFEVSEVSSGSRRLAENVVVSEVSEASSVKDVELVHATAGDSERIFELLEVPQLAEIGGAAESAAHATAGDSEGIIGLHVSHPPCGMLIDSSNSLGCVAAVACARLPAVPGVSAFASSCAAPASFEVVAHVRSPLMHDARNSWSDTGRNARCTGGLLLVCKSTSHNLEVGRQGPTRRRGTKGGVSGPAEDLRPVSEVEEGRPAVYGGRLQVHFPGGNQAQVPGR